MARRKRTRRHVRRAVTPRRRRRRAVAVSVRSNPPRRRRRLRVRHVVTNPRHRRRRARHNPPIRGIVGGIVRDLQNGLGAWGGLVATRKIRGAITGMLPATTQAAVQSAAGKIGLSLASAVVASIVARRVLPRYAPYIAAGAFAEVVDCAVQQTPVAAYFSAYPRPFRAYPTPAGLVTAGGRTALPARAGGLRAYPLPRAVGSTVGA